LLWSFFFKFFWGLFDAFFGGRLVGWWMHGHWDSSCGMEWIKHLWIENVLGDGHCDSLARCVVVTRRWVWLMAITWHNWHSGEILPHRSIPSL
jgi:hypothetical protein